jgi:hypothetical protein
MSDGIVETMKRNKWQIFLLFFLLLSCNIPIQSGSPASEAPASEARPTETPPAAQAASDGAEEVTPAATVVEEPLDDRPVYKDLSERPQIWFGPLDPWSWDQYFPGEGPFQYYDLFTEEAAWQQASEAVHVIRLYPVWLESYATPAQIETVLADIQRRGMAISYEAGPLTETERCNAATVEGFWGVPAAENIIHRIADAGGTLYAMDLEHAFDAGTYYDPACLRTPAEIAEDSARTVSAVQEVFPDVKVGSIETADLDVDAVADWLTAYREATGQELDYFHLDINFSRPDWAQRAKEIEAYVRSRGVEFGLIYFGDVEDDSDAEWLAHAEERFVEYEVINGGQPDHVIFQSWHRHPQKLFPETDGDAFTNLILRYIRPRTILTLRLDGQRAWGSLLDQDGAAMTDAAIELSARPVSGQGFFTEYVITGVVPEEASWADTGFRINMECDCRGPAEFVLEQVDYMDGGAGGVPNGAFSGGLEGWGSWGNGSANIVASANGTGGALAVSVSPDQDLGMNSGRIQIAPGSPFTITFTARVDPITANSGYFDIIFLNDTREVRRFTTPIVSGPVQLAKTTTGPNGEYEIVLDNLPAGAFDLVAWHPGSDAFWPARRQLNVER